MAEEAQIHTYPQKILSGKFILDEIFVAEKEENIEAVPEGGPDEVSEKRQEINSESIEAQTADKTSQPNEEENADSSSPHPTNFLFEKILNLSELKNEEAGVYNTEVLQRFRLNTLRFKQEKNWSPETLRDFLVTVEQNDKEILGLFDLINDEFQNDLLECHEDLKLLNEEIQLWQVSGIAVDVSKNRFKIGASIRWMDSKKKQMQNSIEQFSSITKNIRDHIDEFYQKKDTKHG